MNLDFDLCSSKLEPSNANKAVLLDELRVNDVLPNSQWGFWSSIPPFDLNLGTDEAHLSPSICRICGNYPAVGYHCLDCQYTSELLLRSDVTNRSIPLPGVRQNQTTNPTTHPLAHFDASTTTAAEPFKTINLESGIQQSPSVTTHPPQCQMSFTTLHLMQHARPPTKAK